MCYNCMPLSLTPQTGLGLGVGCGVGVGVGLPIKLSGLPVLSDAAAGITRGVAAVDTALGGPLARLRRAVAGVGAGRSKVGLAAGVGCGVGVGYGYGAGLFAPRGAGDALAARVLSMVAALPFAGGRDGAGDGVVSPPPPSPAALAATVQALTEDATAARARVAELEAREVELRGAFCERNRRHRLCVKK